MKQKDDTLDNLRDCLGYVQNGTNETVTICQDDATYEYVVKIGGRMYHSRSLSDALNQGASAER